MPRTVVMSFMRKPLRTHFTGTLPPHTLGTGHRILLCAARPPHPLVAATKCVCSAAFAPRRGAPATFGLDAPSTTTCAGSHTC